MENSQIMRFILFFEKLFGRPIDPSNNFKGYKNIIINNYLCKINLQIDLNHCQRLQVKIMIQNLLLN